MKDLPKGTDYPNAMPQRFGYCSTLLKTHLKQRKKPPYVWRLFSVPRLLNGAEACYNFYIATGKLKKAGRGNVCAPT